MMTVRDSRIVYVVDDDDDVRDSMEELLRCYGFTVVGCASGREFLGELDPAAGLCIILDLHMPGVSGFQVLDTLQATRNLLPIILFSGRSDSTTEEFAHRSGVIALLGKPIDTEKMVSLIEQCASEEAAA